jgi:dTDP-4-dehydrorhamnose reductase
MCPPPESRPRVLVTGAAGMLGTALLAVLRSRWEVTATDLAEGVRLDGVGWRTMDIRDEAAVAACVEELRPNAVVHCAAIVDVDRCEADPDAARAIHVTSTGTVADALAGTGGRLVYVSTDSVFDGTKSTPYVESDQPRPLNTYAASKLMGERRALELGGQALVLRTNIFGWTPAPKPSFAEWLVQGMAERIPLGMFNDVYFTPLHVAHLSRVIDLCLGQSLGGLFHATGTESLTKYDFALAAADVFGLSLEAVTARSVDDAGLAARRPKYMSLSNEALSRRLGMRLADAREGLQIMRREYEEGWAARIKARRSAPPWNFSDEGSR